MSDRMNDNEYESGRAAGYAAALRDAQAAVKALDREPLRYEDEMEPYVSLLDAIAAITALGGESHEA